MSFVPRALQATIPAFRRFAFFNPRVSSRFIKTSARHSSFSPESVGAPTDSKATVVNVNVDTTSIANAIRESVGGASAVIVKATHESSRERSALSFRGALYAALIGAGAVFGTFGLGIMLEQKDLNRIQDNLERTTERCTKAEEKTEAYKKKTEAYKNEIEAYKKQNERFVEQNECSQAQIKQQAERISDLEDGIKQKEAQSYATALWGFFLGVTRSPKKAMPQFLLHPRKAK